MTRIATCLAVVLLVAMTAQTVAADPLDVLGSFDPGWPGFNASAVGLDGIAYLGSWGHASECPALGVRVIDVHDPTAPVMITSAAVYRGTTAEHLAAVHFTTPSGLAMWDITDPANPTELGFLATGRARGVHEFTVRQRGDRWYAYLAVSNSQTTEGAGDLRIVDVTDPRQPAELLDWGAKRDAGLPVGNGHECAPYCRGAVPQAFLHSVTLSPD